MFNLRDKVAIITGASGSIGEVCSRLFHELGAKVIISGTNQEKLEKIAVELGDRCVVHKCDLRNYEECSALIKGVNPDILLCNAGVTRDSLSLSMPIEDFEDVMRINLMSTFLLNKEAIKSMLRLKKNGRVINMSSVVAFTGNAGQANYCASKSGIIGMTKAIAQEVAKRGITVNTIVPGFIESNMTNVLSDNQKVQVQTRIPIGRFGLPIDVAYMAAFLASECSSYITGQCLHVNGGLLMH